MQCADRVSHPPQRILNAGGLLLVQHKHQDSSSKGTALFFLWRELLQMGEQALAIMRSQSRSRSCVKKFGYTYSFSRSSSNTSISGGSQWAATSHAECTGDTPCATRLLAVKSSLPTVIRIGSCKKEVAKRRTASGHVALTMFRASQRQHQQQYREA
jgi:hypothetical protein